MNDARDTVPDGQRTTAPVTVNVAGPGPGGGSQAASRADLGQVLEWAYRYGVSVLFACVLLGALLFYANRLDALSRENQRSLQQTESSLRANTAIMASINSRLEAIERRLPTGG